MKVIDYLGLHLGIIYAERAHNGEPCMMISDWYFACVRQRNPLVCKRDQIINWDYYNA